MIIIPLGPFMAGFVGALAAELITTQVAPKVKKKYQKIKAVQAQRKADKAAEDILEPSNTIPY